MGEESDKSDKVVEMDNVLAGECRMPQELILDDIENCWPRWQRFKQSFNIYLLAAGYDRLAETRKAAILLNCIGQQAQDVYLNTLRPENPEKDKQDKLQEVIKVFDEYFKPKQNEVINSYNFNKRCQEDGETFDAFYTAIRKLADNCNFGDQKNRMLRDRIVIGVQDQRMQQKLLEIKDLSLEKAVDISRSAELSKEHVKRLNRDNPEVHAVQSGSRPQYQHAATWESKAKYPNNNHRFPNNNASHSNNSNKYFNKNYYLCKKCNTEHGPRTCPAYGKKCAKCNRLNHFSVGCTFTKKVHDINKADTDNNDKDNYVHDL